MPEYQRDVPDLSAYCEKCEAAKAVEKTYPDNFNLLECGHLQRVSGTS